jgi:hypothetical protein
MVQVPYTYGNNREALITILSTLYIWLF